MNKFLFFSLPALISLSVILFITFYSENIFQKNEEDDESFYRSGYVAVTEIEILDSYINRSSSLEEYLFFKDSIINTIRSIVKNSEFVSQKCDDAVSVRLKHFNYSISGKLDLLTLEEMDEETVKAALLKIKSDSWKLRDIIEHGLRKKMEQTAISEELYLLKLKKWFASLSIIFLFSVMFLTFTVFYYMTKSSKILKVIGVSADYKMNEISEAVKKQASSSGEESVEIQRKLLREQIVSKRKSALLDTIPAGIFSSDSNGNLTYLNRKMYEWFNVSENTVGDSVETVFSLMGITDLKKEKFVFNGDIYWIFLQEISKENFYVVRNITGQEELARKLLDSERLVSIGEMASRITHEIRNPLSTIKLNAEYLAENVEELDDSQISQSIELIVKEVVRLESITDKYMNMVRYRNNDESEVLTSLPVDLFELVSFYHSEFEKRKIEISVEKCEECTVSITLSSFKEIILNLFKNAWEELCDGGAVLVNVNITGNKITLKIEDSGRGIPEKEREEVFKNFYTKKPGGTGIGLSHSRKLAVEAGGKLYAADSKIGGICMILELPAKRNHL